MFGWLRPTRTMSSFICTVVHFEFAYRPSFNAYWLLEGRDLALNECVIYSQLKTIMNIAKFFPDGTLSRSLGNVAVCRTRAFKLGFTGQC